MTESDCTAMLGMRRIVVVDDDGNLILLMLMLRKRAVGNSIGQSITD